MIRPELLHAAKRWREALVGMAVALLGLFWAVTAFGVLQWLGWVVVLVGLALILAGVQRGRLRQGSDGPGVVTVDERRITYLGPETGGVADLDLLQRLDLLPDGPVWRLTAETGAVLDIPVDARGADQLFDVFAALPGISLDRMGALIRDIREGPQTVWTAGHRRLH